MTYAELAHQALVWRDEKDEFLRRLRQVENVVNGRVWVTRAEKLYESHLRNALHPEQVDV